MDSVVERNHVFIEKQPLLVIGGCGWLVYCSQFGERFSYVFLTKIVAPVVLKCLWGSCRLLWLPPPPKPSASCSGRAATWEVASTSREGTPGDSGCCNQTRKWLQLQEEKKRGFWEGSATEEKGQPIKNPQNNATESTGLSLAMGLGDPREAGDTMAVVFHVEILP